MIARLQDSPMTSWLGRSPSAIKNESSAAMEHSDATKDVIEHRLTFSSRYVRLKVMRAARLQDALGVTTAGLAHQAIGQTRRNPS
jgi:hypothetical protein